VRSTTQRRGSTSKGVLVALGDDVECHLQGLGPGGELAGVPGIGPDQADTAAGTVAVPQQRPGALAVLDEGGCDHHVQDQVGGVHGDVALAAASRALSRRRECHTVAGSAHAMWWANSHAILSISRQA